MHRVLETFTSEQPAVRRVAAYFPERSASYSIDCRSSPACLKQEQIIGFRVFLVDGVGRASVAFQEHKDGLDMYQFDESDS